MSQPTQSDSGNLSTIRRLLEKNQSGLITRPEYQKLIDELFLASQKELESNLTQEECLMIDKLIQESFSGISDGSLACFDKIDQKDSLESAKAPKRRQGNDPGVKRREGRPPDHERSHDEMWKDPEIEEGERGEETMLRKRTSANGPKSQKKETEKTKRKGKLTLDESIEKVVFSAGDLLPINKEKVNFIKDLLRKMVRAIFMQKEEKKTPSKSKGKQVSSKMNVKMLLGSFPAEYGTFFGVSKIKKWAETRRKPIGTRSKVTPESSLIKKRSAWIERHIFQLSRAELLSSETIPELEKSRELTLFRGSKGPRESKKSFTESQKVLQGILRKEGGPQAIQMASNRKVFDFLDYLLTIQVKNLIENAIRHRDKGMTLKQLDTPLSIQEYKKQGDELLKQLESMMKISLIKKKGRSLESAAFSLFCSDWEEFLPELTREMPDIFEGMPHSRISQKSSDAPEVEAGEEIERIALQLKLLDSPRTMWVKMGPRLRLFWFDRCLLVSFFKGFFPFHEAQLASVESGIREAKYKSEMFIFFRQLFLQNIEGLVGLSKTQFGVWAQNWFKMFFSMKCGEKEKAKETPKPLKKIPTFLK